MPERLSQMISEDERQEYLDQYVGIYGDALPDNENGGKDVSLGELDSWIDTLGNKAAEITTPERSAGRVLTDSVMSPDNYQVNPDSGDMERKPNGSTVASELAADVAMTMLPVGAGYKAGSKIAPIIESLGGKVAAKLAPRIGGLVGGEAWANTVDPAIRGRELTAGEAAFGSIAAGEVAKKVPSIKSLGQKTMDTLATEGGEAAMKYGEKFGPHWRDSRKLFPSGQFADKMAQSAKIVKGLSDDGGMANVLASELQGGTGQLGAFVANGVRRDADMVQSLIDEGLIEGAGSVKGIMERAGSALKDTGGEMENVVALAKERGLAIPREQLEAVLVPENLAAIADRYRISGATRGLSAAIDNEILTMKADLRAIELPDGTVPIDKLIGIVRNFNEKRRLLKEFSKGNYINDVSGQVAQLEQHEGSVTAMKAMQDSVGKVIEGAVPGFDHLNRRYSALSSLEDLARVRIESDGTSISNALKKSSIDPHESTVRIGGNPGSGFRGMLSTSVNPMQTPQDLRNAQEVAELVEASKRVPDTIMAADKLAASPQLNSLAAMKDPGLVGSAKSALVATAGNLGKEAAVRSGAFELGKNVANKNLSIFGGDANAEEPRQSKPLPRDVTALDQIPPDAVLKDKEALEMLTQAKNSNPVIREKIIAKLAQDKPEYFEPPPEAMFGYKSFVGGKLHDPLERKTYAGDLVNRIDALRSKIGDDEAEHLITEYKDALNRDGLILETHKALPALIEDRKPEAEKEVSKPKETTIRKMGKNARAEKKVTFPY